MLNWIVYTYCCILALCEDAWRGTRRLVRNWIHTVNECLSPSPPAIGLIWQILYRLRRSATVDPPGTVGNFAQPSPSRQPSPAQPKLVNGGTAPRIRILRQSMTNCRRDPPHCRYNYCRCERRICIGSDQTPEGSGTDVFQLPRWMSKERKPNQRRVENGCYSYHP